MIKLTFQDLVVVAVALSVGGLHLYARRKNRRLPPGPKGYPVIGNVFDMPASQSWKTFAKWGERYGGIMSITLLGQPFIILNDPAVATEILDRRGNNYADRPTFEMASLAGWDRVLSRLETSSPEIFSCGNFTYIGQRSIRPKVTFLCCRVIGTRGSMEKFYPVEEYQGNMFLKRVLEDPVAFESATRKSAAAMVLQLTYGYKIEEKGSDPFVDLADKGMAEFSEIMRPGAFLIEVLPILKYVPSWFPGANFKRLAEKYNHSCDELAEVPLAYAQGQAASSYTADLLGQPELTAQKYFDIKWSAASFYSAGSDTTVSVVTAYFLAAAIYPHIQEKAQTEMDEVVGQNRLPTFDDRVSLPYIDALCKELCRWLPVVPLAAPHRAMKDDMYGDYFIPKDAFVIPNIWKFLHDPAIYRDPFLFNPDRFLGPNPEPHPADMGLFGYGRRICPGIHLADVSVWISVAKAVAGLTISRAMDDHGKPIDPIADVTDGIVSRPLPFKCIVKPRSEQVLKMVHEATSNML
ncbi:Cytochrome P450 [Mycena venus]|uniref:Cytochrome P450 n=1 Tax=Mycena venus TaxID=2733690 RepID=A0A8H6XNG0_9AGAR|nr:Cytochrome P450 [Mycena venus]